MQRVTNAERAAFRKLVKVERLPKAVRLYLSHYPGPIALDARAARIMAAVLNEEALRLERSTDEKPNVPALPESV
jgi:hypothetical protein